MITVHHLNNSRSQRILWLLEELGLEYEVKRYERDPKTMAAPESLKKVHPLGKSPVITDDASDQTIAESGAIVEYLSERYGIKERSEPMLPDRESGKFDKAYWDCRYWLHYAEGSLMPPLLVGLITAKLRATKMPFFAKPIAKKIANQIDKSFTQPRLKEHFTFVNEHLAGRSWFAGDHLTAADIQMSFPLEAASARGLIDEKYPNIRKFVDMIHARPAYKAGLERGGEYDYA